MLPVQIADGVHWIGVNDRTTDLFEGLWPIDEEGISYNAYWIDDEKKAVVDLSKGTETRQFLSQIEAVGDVSDIDYVIVNHLEPDHSGLLEEIRRLAPGAAMVGSPKMVEMLAGFYDIEHNVQAVEDGDTISLGRTELRFLMTPFLHWPETMMTYDASRRILFSGDGFGSYGALKGVVFEDQVADRDWYEQEALRYFTNVIAKFYRMVKKAADRLREVDISVLAPAHGLCWRNQPRRIIDLYRHWSEYAETGGDCGVTVIYGSMYGYTEAMMNAVVAGIAEAGVAVEVFDPRRTHASYILPSMWTNKGLVVGAPTYEGELFPAVAQLLRIAAMKAVRHKKVALFGSYGWAGGAEREFKEAVEPMDVEVVETLQFCGRATSEQLREGRRFGRRFGEALKGSV